MTTSEIKFYQSPFKIYFERNLGGRTCVTRQKFTNSYRYIYSLGTKFLRGQTQEVWDKWDEFFKLP
jgi:hypothetical protein